MGFRESLKGVRRRASLLMVMVAVTAIAAGFVGQADAGNSGQLGTVSLVQGTVTGKLSTPKMMAAEAGGSLFISDRPAGDGQSPFRLQKFSATGTVEGSLELATPNEEVFKAIAVDSTAHLIYLLREKPGSDPETGEAMAETILIYSTIPNPTTHLLEAPSTGPTSFTLPTDAAHVIDNPTDMVLDTHDQELEIAGENREGKYVLQRFGTAAGASGPRYTEASGSSGLNELTAGSGSAGGLAIAPDGTSYVVWFSAVEEKNAAVTLPETLTGNPTSLTGFAGASEAILIQRIRGGVRDGSGAQVAISPDGSTIYYKTALSVEPEHGGNILVTALSLFDGKAFAVYGGKNSESHCTVQNAEATLAAVGGDLLAFDQGSGEPVSGFGVKLTEFGPTGSGCPAPSPADAIKVGSTPVEQVHSGTPVTLDASPSELGEWGESVASVTWKVEGPEPFNKTVLSSEPGFSLAVSHTFNTEGSYTVRMSIKFKSKLATPPLPEFEAKPKPLTVTAPAVVPAPTVTAVTPTHGPAAGGNTVTIKGTEFAEATQVHFGATAATGLVQVSGTEVTAVAPSGTAGSTVDVTVTTNEGGPSSPVAADKYTYDVPTQTLSVTKGGAGSGTVTSTPVGISCGTTCSAAFEAGKEVALSATAASGSTFAGWGGACTGTGSCRVTMSAAKSVTATFNLTATQENPAPSGGGNQPATPAPVPVVPPKEKTAAEKLAEKRKAALKKCKKLKGKARAACVKKANAIGKPKQPAKKHASRAGG